jgi:hypothetical protein
MNKHTAIKMIFDKMYYFLIDSYFGFRLPNLMDNIVNLYL